MNLKKKSMSVILITAITLMTACSQAATNEETPKPAATSAPAAAETGKPAAANTPAATSVPAASSTPAAGQKSQVSKIGDTIKVDNLNVTVNGVRESKGDMLKAPDGKVFIVVDVTAENIGTQEELVSSALLTSLIDGDGFKYQISLNDDQKGSFDGPVEAGQKLRGEVSFAVPKEASSFEFQFINLFNQEKGIWKIK